MTIPCCHKQSTSLNFGCGEYFYKENVACIVDRGSEFLRESCLKMLQSITGFRRGYSLNYKAKANIFKTMGLTLN